MKSCLWLKSQDLTDCKCFVKVFVLVKLRFYTRIKELNTRKLYLIQKHFENNFFYLQVK